MAWLVVDKIIEGRENLEAIFASKPIRHVDKHGEFWTNSPSTNGYEGMDVIELPDGSIEKLIGRKLTWEDEPVEI